MDQRRKDCTKLNSDINELSKLYEESVIIKNSKLTSQAREILMERLERRRNECKPPYPPLPRFLWQQQQRQQQQQRRPVSPRTNAPKPAAETCDYLYDLEQLSNAQIAEYNRAQISGKQLSTLDSMHLTDLVNTRNNVRVRRKAACFKEGRMDRVSPPSRSPSRHYRRRSISPPSSPRKSPKTQQHRHPNNTKKCNNPTIPSTHDLIYAARVGGVHEVKTGRNTRILYYRNSSKLSKKDIDFLYDTEMEICNGEISLSKWIEKVESRGFSIKIEK